MILLCCDDDDMVGYFWCVFFFGSISVRVFVLVFREEVENVVRVFLKSDFWSFYVLWRFGIYDVLIWSWIYEMRSGMFKL